MGAFFSSNLQPWYAQADETIFETLFGFLKLKMRTKRITNIT